MGSPVKEVPADGQINVSDLAPGMYILNMDAGNALFIKRYMPLGF